MLLYPRQLRIFDSQVAETIKLGGFFGEEQVLFGSVQEFEFRTVGPSSVYAIPGEVVFDIPTVMWKLLETFEKRSTT